MAETQWKMFSIGVSISNDDTLSVDGQFRYSSSGNQILPAHVTFKDEDNSFELKWNGQKLGYKILIKAPAYIDMLDDENIATYRDSVRELLASALDSADDESATRKKFEEFAKAVNKSRTELGRWIPLTEKKPLELINELNTILSFSPSPLPCLAHC